MQPLRLDFVSLFALFIVWLRPITGAADHQMGTPRSKEELKEAVKQILDETNTPGAGIAIVSRDEILVTLSVGLADRDSKRPVTPDTMFRAGSISKTFTALAILKLQEAGRLSLEDRLCDLTPDVQFTNPWEESDPVRLAHVMEHTAGFDEISLREFATNIPASRLRDDINFDPRPRISRWQPGTFFSYSNADYSVAGYVVEKVSGQSFDEFVESQILKPLDTPKVSFLLTDVVQDMLATGYAPDGVSSRPYGHIIGRPSGALNCTPTELGHLVQMLLNRGTYLGKRILTAESIQRMETPTTGIAARHGMVDGYGLGNYSTAHQGYRFHGHDGAIDGFMASYGYSPEHGVGYALMINAGNWEALQKMQKIVLEYLCLDWPKVTSPPPERSDDEDLARFEGFYEPYTPRLEQSRFLFRLLGIRRITAGDGSLHFSELLSEPQEYLRGQFPDSFRRDEEPGPSILFFEDGAEMYVASANLQLGNLRRLPSWQFWGQSIAILYCASAVLSAIVFPLIWLPRMMLGYVRGPKYLSVRVLPLLAVLSIFGIVLFILLNMSDPTESLGKPTVWSIGLCVLTWLFAILTTASLVQVLRARNWPLNRWVWRHALLVSIANACVLLYLAYWEVIGIRTWT
jgi:CubicO group peptidase (beta-lactamase class C family)